MTIHEIRTEIAAAEVIDRARSFFAHAGTPYAAFAEKAGPGHLRLHMEVGEIMIGAIQREGSTLVRASASRGAHLVTRFLATLAHPLDARRATHRFRLHETHGALTTSFPETAAMHAPAPLAASTIPAPRAA